ncbi:phage capsid protein [Jejubacter calystegiae]|uniref:Phage capsid protein n=1 Tax=Jejubacter calystegiae TaxID=2579935 RepID=A0A4P8YF88_9ENTR|nr:GPO family capsid scaffolding protein [Jejubacter calystegiae]QCT18493.1 phage capsid protein [Jejubacter calystegiae]
MSGSQLATNWICIAAAGDTVDGREIKEQWINDAVELYSPNLYTALLWPEHSRNYGNMGEVLELMKQRDEEGVLKLYARLCPNISLIEANMKGQLIFLSAEFTPDGNFRNTGKTYLEGLGVTDSPASVSTTRLRFSRNKGRRYGAYKPVVFDEVREIKREKDMAAKKKSWRHLFNIEEPQNDPATDPQDDNGDSGDEKLAALAQALSALEERVTKLESSQEQTDQAVEDVQSDVDTVKDAVDNADFATLVKNAPRLVKAFGKLDEKITTLPERKFNKTKKGFNFL